MPTDDSHARAARADVARLLAACHYEPAQAFADEGVFGALQEALSALDADLARAAARLGAAFGAQPVDELLVDYARLFLGPVGTRAQPYGSVWLEDRGDVMGESTTALLAYYEEAGFEVDEAFRDLPDHVAVELEFLYALLFREAEAAVRGDGDVLRSVSVLRQRFLADRLGAWIPRFTAAVRSGAETAFYRELAGITERFIAQECERAG